MARFEKIPGVHEVHLLEGGNRVRRTPRKEASFV